MKALTYLVPVDALEKRVGLDLVASGNVSSHQSTDQITGNSREGTGKKKKDWLTEMFLYR